MEFEKDMNKTSFMPNLISINDDEYLLFRNYIADNCGILVPPEKSYLIETRLSKYMAKSGSESFGEFYDYIISASDPLMPQKIINAITTNETQWFRDSAPWKVLQECLLPRFVDELARGEKKQVRIWSAAASTGQEIYSTAMCIDSYLGRNNVKGADLSGFYFLATDISSDVLSIAKKGRYNKISIMRGLSDYYREKYFVENGSAWDIDPRLRDAVKFESFNLKNTFQIFGKFDIIFCRYVLIYFSDDLKKEIVAKIYNSLSDGGVLFTGNYVLYDLFKDYFDAQHHGNLTYYIKKAVSK